MSNIISPVELTGCFLPAPTWNSFKVNNAKISLPDSINGRVDILKQDTAENTADGAPKFVPASSSLGGEFEEWLLRQPHEELFFTVTGRNSQNSVNHLKLNVQPNEQSAVCVAIYCTAEAEGEFVFECDSPAQYGGMLALSVVCFLEENAKLSLSISQTLGKQFTFLGDVTAVLSQDSSFQLTRADLGADISWLGVNTDLRGERAAFSSALAYVATGESRKEINDVVLHTAKDTSSNMDVNGVLTGKAIKTYRGTIDLRNGCAGSKGSEMEKVLLLSGEARNKTIPLILCGEEDVEGNHGATIGKIDEGLLFYMESRGIPRAQAERLVVNGRLQQVIRRIPAEAVAESAAQFLKEAFA